MSSPRAQAVRLSATILLALSCQRPDRGEPPVPVRLTPVQATGSVNVSALFDRDTTRSLSLSGPVEVTLTFSEEVDLRSVRVIGAEAEVSGAAIETTAASPGSWSTATAAGRTRTLTLSLRPTGPSASVAELEVWGVGQPSAPRDLHELALVAFDGHAPFHDAAAAALEPHELTLVPRGVGEGSACGTLSGTFPATEVAAAQRAILAYEASGIIRAVSLTRRVNGGSAAGGFWLPSTGPESRTLHDEFDPALLTGADSVTLCLPDEATGKVTLRNPRLVLLLDDGTSLLDRDAQAALGAAADGRRETVGALPAGRLEAPLWRAYQLHGARLALDTPAATARAAALDGTGWTSAMPLDLVRGWNTIALPADAAVRALSLELDGQPRPDVPAAGVSEVELVGSPLGTRVAAPRLVISYPPLTARAGVFRGERFGAQAFVAGWAESPAGPGRVEIDGAPVGQPDGSFSTPVARPADAASQVIKVLVKAFFPDGSTLSRELLLEDDRQDELLGDSSGEATLGEAARFGAEEQTAWGLIDAVHGGRVQLGTDVLFEAPPGAVGSKTHVGITHKSPEAIPSLDPGMVNVTAPRGAGYRFQPPGQKFASAVRITLPYEDSLLPDGIPPEQVQTFYFDAALEKWQPLPRKQVLRASRQVVSETTHFTFMVNAVMVLPDHPGPTLFDPNTVKDLQVANPTTRVDVIAPPAASNMGTAQLSFPLQLPAGRGAYSPRLGVSYDSSNANGWMGIGWDLASSRVSIETRFGAPFYDGTERYTLDGQQLVPGGDASCVDGSPGRLFAARVESEFDRIVRCGSDTRSYRFEVTDKSGALSVYGASAGARLAGYRAGQEHIAEWRLERVIDANGNVARFTYEQDRRHSPGTGIDARSGEDFRQLYPKEIYYSGRGSRSGGAALDSAQDTEAGAYLVRFVLEQSGGHPAERPDVVTSGRTGFKVLTRYRLGSVQVRMNTPADQRLIREYRFTYEEGDFHKSRLKRLEVYGAGGIADGALFYAHDFEYTQASSQGGPFATTPWQLYNPSSDDQGLSAGDEWSVGAHAYAGIAVGPSKESGSVGLSVNYSHRESANTAMLIDVNGDNLPDRVTYSGGQLRVQLNDGQQRQLSTLAPAGDPAAGSSIPPFATGINLGKESGDALGVGVQGVFGAFSANVGVSFNWTKSRDFLMDADGDGLPDFIGPGQVLFNEPRTCTGAGCCSPGTFCFGNTKPVGGPLDLVNVTNPGSPLEADPDLAQTRDQVDQASPPTDAMLEWTAPFEGVVDITGALQLLQTSTDPKRDGVRLRIYKHTPSRTSPTTTLLATIEKAASSATPTPIDQTGVPVQLKDRLYFVLSTRRDFPVGSQADGSPIPLEEVKLAPTIRYTSCSGACGSLGSSDATYVDPTGAPLFTFAHQADFKLAGDPFATVTAPRTGTLELTGELKKDGTADDVRVCILRFPAGTTPANRACQSGDRLLQTFASAATGTFPLADTLSVEAGENLVFRIESDLAVDPAAVRWRPKGQMTSVCDATSCHPPSGDESNALQFETDAFYPLHQRAEGIPLRPLVIPRDGTLTLTSSSSPKFPSPLFFTVRENGLLILKHRYNESRTVTRSVTAGEQLFFEAHSELASSGPWYVTARLTYPLPDGGTATLSLSPPLHVTFDNWPKAFGYPDNFTSRLGGGYHGWRYGAWGGVEGSDPFEPQLFYEDVDVSFSGGSDRDKFRDGKGQLNDPNSQASRHSRLYAPLLPRTVGTTTPSTPGLKPAPAFVSLEGSTFITASTLHGGRKGGFSVAGGTQSAVTALFDIGDMTRVSEGTTLSGGLGVGPLSLSVSAGHNAQKVDVRDMNGDGIIDLVVSGGPIRLTHLRDLTPRAAMDGSAAVMDANDLSASVGLGISEPFKDLRANAKVAGMDAMFPSSLGVGLGANLSWTEKMLQDLNGDGLPDEVRLDAAAGEFVVRMNLGTSFGAEDRIPVGHWTTAGTFDPFVQQLHGDVNDYDPGDDSDESGGRSGALDALDALSSPDVVKRNTAVTLEANAGFTLNEAYGASLNTETSVNGTSVSLVDVTGDGLADFVRKSSDEDHFTVRVNRGWSFGPEEIWPVSAWPEGLRKPRLKLPAGAMQELVNNLLLSGGADTVEATGVTSALPSVGFVLTVPILIGPGTPWLLLSGGVNANPRKVSSFQLGLQDINGDGYADHVLKTEEEVADPLDPDVHLNRERVYVRLNLLSEGNLLKRVIQPLGGSFELTYARVGNTVAMPSSQEVLVKVVTRDGLGSGAGHVLTSNFSYQRGLHDRNEREFLGFETVTERRDDGSTHLRRYSQESIRRRGELLYEELRDAGGNLFTSSAYVYGPHELRVAAAADCAAVTPFFLDPQDYCSSTFSPLLRMEKRLYEGHTADVGQPGLTSAQQMQYDDFGNVTRFEDLGNADDPSDDYSAEVEYLTSGAASALHAVDRATHVQVRPGRLGSGGGLLRERFAEYDDHGNMTRLTQQIDPGRAAEHRLTYTEDGNLFTLEGPPNAAQQHYVLTYDYEPQGRSLVSSITDSHGLSSTFEYDVAFGEVTRSVDAAGNALVRHYDGFGRLVDAYGPNEMGGARPAVQSSYDLSARPVFAVTRNLLPQARSDGKRTLDTALFVDGMGRILQTRKDVETGHEGLGVAVSGTVHFDVMGRVEAAGQTFFSADGVTDFTPAAPLINPTLYEHDVLARTVKTTEPNGAVTRTEHGFGSYAGMTVTFLRTLLTDPRQNTQAVYRDAGDRLVAVEEHIEGRAPTTRYEYDALGSLTRVVDAAGNASVMTYDLLGRRTSLTTPDTGLESYEFDLAGNLTRRENPNLRRAGLAITYDYDFNRKTRMNRPLSGTTVYEYGPPGPSADNGAGRLVRVQDESGEERRSYGRLGETTELVRVVRPMKPGDPTRTFSTSFAYDSFGRMLQMQYPDGERLVYRYDGNGMVSGAVGFRAADWPRPAETETYLASIQYDVFGQRTRQVLGNGTISTYGYDDQTRQLKSLTTTAPTGRTLQALSYAYDLAGNPVSMTNAIGPATPRRSGPTSYRYTYDELNRLTSASGIAQARDGLVDRFTSSFIYSDIHTINRSVQVRELIHAQSLDPNVELPKETNFDRAYVYAGAGPHQATQIGELAVTYDLNGNTHIECEPQQGGCAEVAPPPDPSTHRHWRKYEWTEDNLLRGVVDGGGDNATRFFYDSAGQRVAKLGHGGVTVSVGQFFSLKGRNHATKHVFAGGTLIASKLIPVSEGAIGIPPPGGSGGSGGEWPSGLDENDHGCTPSEYQPNKCNAVVIGGPGGSGGRAQVKPATWYYHPDHLGSTTWMTDQNGRVHEHLEYFPYGSVWRDFKGDDDPGSAPRAPAFLFTSKEFDEETGLTYFGARYYDSSRARWLSADPLREQWQEPPSPMHLSLYSYGNHSPIRWKDPDGQSPTLITGAIGAVGGALIGGGIYYWTHRNEGFTGRGLAGAMAGGAVTGGIAGLTMGASLAVQVGVGGVAAGIAGGVTTRGVETGSVSQALDPKKMAIDGIAGGVGAGVGIGLGKGISAIASRLTEPAAATAARGLRLGPGAAGVDEFVEKVINSNMGHAAERAVERAGFSSAQEARTALQQFGAEIERSGIPSTAIRDTAHADRIIVPGFGEGGAVVYQVRNGVLKLKTVLEWIAPSP